MVLADTLSHANIDDCSKSQSTIEDLACVVYMVLDSAPFTNAKLEEVRKATTEDATMMLLKSTILSGWPDKLSETPRELKPFWTYQDELSDADGIILKGEKILIPQSLQEDMLERIYSSHLGVTMCKERARDIIFWPGMGKQIEETVTKCETCQEHQMSNTKEPMTSDELPTSPWQVVATDLFQFKGCDYLLLVDY